MAKWEPIRRIGKPVPKEVHGRIARIELHFPLSAAPPAGWTFNFEWGAKVMTHIEFPPARVKGDVIVVLASHDQQDFANWTEYVDRGIAMANDAYEEILDSIERADDAAVEKWRRERLEEAQRWADELGPPSG
jgi:hypothetical protein